MFKKIAKVVVVLLVVVLTAVNTVCTVRLFQELDDVRYETVCTVRLFQELDDVRYEIGRNWAQHDSQLERLRTALGVATDASAFPSGFIAPKGSAADRLFQVEASVKKLEDAVANSAQVRAERRAAVAAIERALAALEATP